MFGLYVQYRNFACLWSNLIFWSSSVIPDSSDFGLCLRFLSLLTFLLTSNFVVTFRLLIWDFAIEKILLIPPPPPTSAPNFALKNTLIQKNIAVKIEGFQSYVCISISQFRPFPQYTFNISTWRKSGSASNPLFILPGFFLHFLLELSYGYLWFEGNGKIPLGR